MKKTLLTFLGILLITILLSQENRIPVLRSDGTKTNIFMSGGNLAWDQFANDFGPGATNFDYFDEVFTAFENAGGNAMRLWVHINGANNPNLDGNGYCTGLEESQISDMQRVLDLAYNHNIVLVLSLWSFDMLNNRDYPAEVSAQGELILTVEDNIQAYIDNALIPMVEAFKDHPAVGAWEIFNEPEGMSNEFGWSHTNHVPMSVIQRFVNRLTGAIHRTDADAQVTNGSWAMYASSDVPTGSDTYKNYYSDEELIAAGGDADGTLDFYQVHYYDWMSNDISVMHHPASYWGLDKAIVVGEFFPLDAAGIAWNTYYDYLYNNGYAGALTWQWAGENNSTEPYRTNMVALMESIRDYDDILIEEGRNRFPVISSIDNGLFDMNSGTVINYIDLDDVATDPDGDVLTFSVLSNSNTALVNASINQSNQVDFTFTPEMTGFATIVIQVADPDGLTAITEFNIVVREAGTGNLALFRTTVYTLHNEEGTSTADPLYATDGDYNTRWSSAYQDPAWYYIDLGQQCEINQVVLYWEVAYGQQYEIQVSNDASTWTTVYTESSGNGATDYLTFATVTAQYVRMYGIQRATEWGYSLYEFEVYGPGSSENKIPVAVISADITSGTAPLSVNFIGTDSYDTDGTIESYSWDFGDGTYGSGAYYSHSYSIDGSYLASLIVTDNVGDTGISTIEIVVGSGLQPVTGVELDGCPSNNLIVGSDFSLLANVLPSNASDKTVVWESSDNSVAAVDNNGNVSTNGIGTAVITVTTNDGSFMATCMVTVIDDTGENHAPVAEIIADANTGTPGLLVNFSASGSIDSDGDDLTYSWDFGDGATAGGIIASHTYDAIGTYTATVVVSDGELNDDASITIIISNNSLPCENPTTISLPFTQDGEGTICFFTMDDIAYVNSWNTEEVTINGFDFSNTWSNLLPDKKDDGYYITYIGLYGWSHFEIAALKDGKTIELSDVTNITLYPNPFSETLNISIDKPEYTNSIQVFDQIGRLVEAVNVEEITTTNKIGTDLKSGIYILKVGVSNKVKTYMVTKF